VGGVSARDARGIAEELHTTSNFIESMRRRGDRSEFAVWLKQTTPKAIRLSVPLGFLERQPLLSEEAFEQVIEANRAKYCGTEADIAGFEMPVSAEAEPPPSEPALPGRALAPPEPRTPRLAQEERPPPPSRDRPVREEPVRSHELGKGGSQHRYVQQLIRQLAEERGLRVVVEEAVPGGQVDVGLHQGDLSIACEISITSTPEYEAQNLAKCLRAGFTRIWAIAPDAKRRRAIQVQAEARLGTVDVERVEFFTTEEMIEALDGLSVPEPEEKIVKGYRVRTTHKAITPAEAKARRADIARILSQSMRATR
jgi:hypothetical protein